MFCFFWSTSLSCFQLLSSIPICNQIDSKISSFFLFSCRTPFHGDFKTQWVIKCLIFWAIISPSTQTLEQLYVYWIPNVINKSKHQVSTSMNWFGLIPNQKQQGEWRHTSSPQLFKDLLPSGSHAVKVLLMHWAKLSSTFNALGQII